MTRLRTLAVVALALLATPSAPALTGAAMAPQ